MGLIKNVAAWFSTEGAVEWVKFTTPDGVLVLRKVDPLGVELILTDKTSRTSAIGINSTDLVKIGRYLLEVAASHGQNINKGFNPGGEQ